jgi:hypothetical protein
MVAVSNAPEQEGKRLFCYLFTTFFTYSQLSGAAIPLRENRSKISIQEIFCFAVFQRQQSFESAIRGRRRKIGDSRGEVSWHALCGTSNSGTSQQKWRLLFRKSESLDYSSRLSSRICRFNLACLTPVKETY